MGDVVSYFRKTVSSLSRSAWALAKESLERGKVKSWVSVEKCRPRHCPAAWGLQGEGDSAPPPRAEMQLSEPKGAVLGAEV